MTFKQLEQFLKTEKWRAGVRQESDACGKYARCAYCDRFSDYPCARAYDTLMRKKREGRTPVSFWQFPEPDVKGKFGTVFASEYEIGGATRICIDPEDLYGFSLGGRAAEPCYGRTGEAGPLSLPAHRFLPAAAERVEEIKETKERIGVISMKSYDKKKTRVLVIKRRAKNHSL